MAAASVQVGRPLTKRPRSSTPDIVVEISSDDDEPASKRQKSTTPIVNGINGIKHTAKPLSSAKHISASTQSRVQPSSPAVITVKKPPLSKDIVFTPTHKNSVFKNVPQWKIKSQIAPARASGSGSTPDRPSKPSPAPISTPAPSATSRSGLPRRSLRQSASPVDKYHIDSSDDDLKILENFKIADNSAKRDRLRPQNLPTTVRPVQRSTDRLRQATPPRSTSFRINVAYRPSPVASATKPKPPQPIQQPVLELRSIPSPKPSPAYQFVPSPSTQFELIVPLSQDALGGHDPKRKPVPYIVDEAREKKTLLDELKRGTTPIKTRLADVEKFFGQTGFSESFSTNADELRLQRLASKKLRKVKRKNVMLDWSSMSPVQPRNDEDNSDDSVVTLIHPVQQVKQLLTARFQEPHDPPLTFANDINDRRLNGKFQFVDRYIYCSGVRTANSSTNYGCGCQYICNPSHCTCFNHQIGGPQFANMRPIQTYTERPDGLVVLSEDYMLNELTPSASHFEISECNTNCGCSPLCFNKVVTRGRTVPLEVFETAKCGFGVRSSVDIVKGQFIDLYLGEVITQQELERREQAKEENASSYIYSLDWFTQQNCYHVDGENFGTAMRFVNHRCSPNARNFSVQTHKGDKHVYYLAFFAIKDIPAGTEICIDYTPQEDGKYVDSDDGKGDVDEDDNEEEGRARCHCGADNCRKFLWRSAGRKRKKRKTTKHD